MSWIPEVGVGELGSGSAGGAGLGILTLGVALCRFEALEGVGVCGEDLQFSLLGLMGGLHASQKADP